MEEFVGEFVRIIFSKKVEFIQQHIQWSTIKVGLQNVVYIYTQSLPYPVKTEKLFLINFRLEKYF